MLDIILIVLALATGGGGGASDPDVGLAPEPQVATGRFLTALEVKPVLTATRANWVAVREYEGQDLVYLTQIWSWRCGLVAFRGAINDAPLDTWPLPPCHDDTASPNAIIEGDGLPYLPFPLNSVETITVEITYDDLTTETVQFDRRSVLMP